MEVSGILPIFALQKRSNNTTIFALNRLGTMIIERKQYVDALLNKRWNGKVKIITGIRRCGKSFLLSTLYKNHLKKEGVAEECFVEIALDRKSHIKYRNPNELYTYVLGRTQDEQKRYYVFIDEIQLSIKIKNKDIDELRDFVMDAYISGLWQSKNPQITKMHADAVIGANN